MKKNRIIFILWITILIVAVVWSIHGILDIKKDKEMQAFSVIVDDSYNESWLVTRKGFERAAEENNIIMNYVSTNKFESVEQQIEMVKREISNGADGVIIKWISSDVALEQIKEAVDGKALVMLDSDVSTEGAVHVCGVDNYEYGKAVANQFIDSYQNAGTARIGLFLEDENLVSTTEQLAGVKDVLAENGIEEKLIMYNNGEENQKRLGEIIKRNEVDVILSLGKNETEIVVDSIVENKKYEVSLYGAGYSKKNVYYLDKQVVDGLVVADEFNKGYQAVQELVRQINYHSVETMKSTIGFSTANYENMYDVTNEKLLFPIVQ